MPNILWHAPPPLDDQRTKVLLRMPLRLKERFDQVAKEQGISLNCFALTAIDILLERFELEKQEQPPVERPVEMEEFCDE